MSGFTFLRMQLPPISFSPYTTLESSGILEFKVPNLAAQLQIDTLSVPSFPASGGLRKIAKHVTFMTY